MKTVGIRELKNHLSAYVRHVSAGNAVRVTDRGKVVAELTPPREPRAVDLADLARRGLLTRAETDAKRYPALPRALKRRKSSKLLNSERDDR